MSELGEPYTGPELQAALRDVQGAADAYLRQLRPAMFFTPQGTAWSPAEHARHLRKSLQPLARVLRWPRPVLRLLFGRHHGPSRDFAAIRQCYQTALAAGGQAGRFAPAPQPTPSDLALGQARVLTVLDQAVAAVQAGVAPWTEAALDRYQLPHPLLGRLTAREMLAFSVYHHAHHLRRVAERAGTGASSDAPLAPN
jgi:hypothetical protein